MTNTKEFKYPTIPMFFDADKVACTFVDELIVHYPDLEDKFINKSWDIEHLTNSELSKDVIAVVDAEKIIEENE